MLLTLSTSIQISWSITKIVRTALQEKTEKCKLWCCASSFPTTLMKKLDHSLLIWPKLRRNGWFSKFCVVFLKFIAKITYMAIWSLRTSSSRVMIGCLSQIWIHTNLSHSLTMISRTTTCTLETWTTIQDAILHLNVGEVPVKIQTLNCILPWTSSVLAVWLQNFWWTVYRCLVYLNFNSIVKENLIQEKHSQK